MPIFRRELAFRADSPVGHTREWWHLILDTDTPGLWVEHTRIYKNPHSEGAEKQDEQRYGINDFLSLTEGQEAQSMLLAALSELFKDGSLNR
jgi:hypothetical protein